ncbi:hypothetical protein [Bradyrhizobium sp. Leo170]|uniref:hypothetical protein n=1 Tax=Bradyrhizobium sp. Leo170 TaxID=1571199 RepID=UPI001A914E18|nr:hypothetical protein [Bradyrhizobium sp. Leo170]
MGADYSIADISLPATGSAVRSMNAIEDASAQVASTMRRFGSLPAEFSRAGLCIDNTAAASVYKPLRLVVTSSPSRVCRRGHLQSRFGL